MANKRQRSPFLKEGGGDSIAEKSQRIRYGTKEVAKEDVASLGHGRTLVPPPFCFAEDYSDEPQTIISYAGRGNMGGGSFYHFFLGEIFPFVEFLATHARPASNSSKDARLPPMSTRDGSPVSFPRDGRDTRCFPRRLTIYGRPGAYDFKRVYRDFVLPFGIKLKMHGMHESKFISMEARKPPSSTGNNWRGGVLFLDGHFFQNPAPICQKCTATSCARNVVANPAEARAMIEVPSCSQHPTMFQIEQKGSNQACPLTCADIYTGSSRVRCVAVSSEAAARKARFRGRFHFVREWLLKWAGVGGGEFNRVTHKKQKLVAMVQLRAPRANNYNGALRRNITNLHHVATQLNDTFGSRFRELRVAAAEGLSLKEQIIAHHDVDIFIFGHGAGMIQMLWMPPGGLVVEISRSTPMAMNGAPKSPHHGAAMLSEIAGLEHQNVFVSDSYRSSDFRQNMGQWHQTGFSGRNVHASVDVEEVLATLRGWLARRDGQSPSCTRPGQRRE